MEEHERRPAAALQHAAARALRRSRRVATSSAPLLAGLLRAGPALLGMEAVVHGVDPPAVVVLPVGPEIFGTKDHRDYAIVASGGFFTPGQNSIVVPIRSLAVTQNGESFFLPMSSALVKSIPLMPDQEYKWLSDEAWRKRNDALFVRP